MPEITTDESAQIQMENLLSWQRNAHELRVLLGAIACMAAPIANQELKSTIQLARAISDELHNDMDTTI